MAEQKSTVSIVIPLFNKAAVVGRAIESVLQQRFEDWRLIVVDDGSTDNGADIVRGIEDDRIELLQQANRGPGAARNAGLAKVETEFVTFLDADDEWYPWFLANSLKAIRENDVAMVTSMFHQWPEGTDWTDVLAGQGIEPGEYFFKGDEDPVRVNNIISPMNAWNSLLYSEIARKYDGFYEKERCLAGEDKTFLMRVAFGERFMLIGPAAVRYHTEESDLYVLSRPRPLQPYLACPDEVLRYCPAQKRELAQKVLDLFALGQVQRSLRFGKRLEALKLLRRFDGIKIYKEEYQNCLKRMIPGFRLWGRFKGAIIKR